MAKRPPSSCTIGRRSGGITGTASSTMPIGELILRPSSSSRLNAEMTLSRLIAFALRWPLAVTMISLRNSSSASMSMREMRSLIASAPMPPAKYSS